MPRQTRPHELTTFSHLPTSSPVPSEFIPDVIPATTSKWKKYATPTNIAILVLTTFITTLAVLVILLWVKMNIQVHQATPTLSEIYRAARPPLNMTYHKSILISASTQASVERQIIWHPTLEDNTIAIEARGIRSKNVRNGQERFIARFDVQCDDAMISPQGAWILLVTQKKAIWKHSFTAVYYLFNSVTRKHVKLMNGQPLQVVHWINDTLLAVVVRNNIYLCYTKDPQNCEAVTKNGSDYMFHGRPDWIYEEEIFHENRALWTTDNSLLFLSLDETNVTMYDISNWQSDHINPKSPITPSMIQYPKPGSHNPVPTVTILNLSSNRTVHIPIETDEILGEVLATSWFFVVKILTRDQRSMRTLTYNSTQLMHERSFLETGWINLYRQMRWVPDTEFYLDIAPVDGWNHIVRCSSITGSCLPLTTGKWEVTSILGGAWNRNLAFIQTTRRDSTERHIYAVNIFDGQLTAISPETEGYYSASFSPSGLTYLLGYEGPNLPYAQYQSIQDEGFVNRLPRAEGFLMNQTLERYSFPAVSFFSIDTLDAQFKMNIQVYFPTQYRDEQKEIEKGALQPEDRTRFPVIIHCHGSPGSQTVTKRYAYYSWYETILSGSEKPAIVMQVDNRGTGFQGRRFETATMDQIGLLEAEDHIVARNWIVEQGGVDDARIGLWGWGFGGYLTLKTLEVAPVGMFATGIAVAPVTDWRYYNSIYAERYMRAPSVNREGYDRAVIHEMANIRHLEKILICHGTADDQVHFQHTSSLVRRFTWKKMTNYEVSMYFDSGHSINSEHAQVALYKKMISWWNRYLATHS